jgi:streptomycin 6-kinase
VVVLKVGRRHYEADHEADGLQVWQGHGTVRLLAATRPDDATDALLLEACEPGTSASSLPEADQDVVVATMLRALWIAPPVDGPFRPLSSMADAWVTGLDAARAERLVGDPGIVRAGVALFRDLSRTADGPPVLLVTDLHAGNILAARRQPWLVIDPKPYAGDRTYDPLQHMLNCPQRLTTTPRVFVDRFAGLLDLDRPRLTQWLFARCVLGCCEQPELAAVARTLAPA